MSGHSHVWRSQRGVTLVELIAVMIIIGVLGAIAATRYFDRAGFDADAFTDQSRAMLRYAQKVAVAQNRNVFVRLNSDSVALCFDSACSAPASGAAPSGANSGCARDPAALRQFHHWYLRGATARHQLCAGPAPVPACSISTRWASRSTAADAAGTSAVSTFAARSSMTIAGDGSTRTITVEPETGYVH